MAFERYNRFSPLIEGTAKALTVERKARVLTQRGLLVADFKDNGILPG